MKREAVQSTEISRKRFISWYEENLTLIFTPEIEKKLIQTLNTIGVCVESIFDERNAQKIRTYSSLLLSSRQSCGCSNSKDYIEILMPLISYAEYIDIENNQKSTKLHVRDRLHDSLAISYFLSRKNKTALSILGYRCFNQAFSDLGKLLNQKPSTIKNMRDEFDPFFENGRVGWYQKPLSASRREVFDHFNTMQDDELSKVILGIISFYKVVNISTQKNDSKKVRIVVSSGNLKEIKSKVK